MDSHWTWMACSIEFFVLPLCFTVSQMPLLSGTLSSEGRMLIYMLPMLWVGPFGQLMIVALLPPLSQ